MSNQAKEIVELNGKIDSLQDMLSDYVALEVEAIEIANQMKTAVDSWES